MRGTPSGRETKHNGLSVGIETVHTDIPTPQSFTEAQYTTLLRLVKEIRAAHAGITRQRVVGHSDVKIEDDNDFKLSRSRRGCPGDQFDWARFEAANMARTMTAGPPPETIYGIKAGEKLARAPAKKAPVASPEVEELKRDLSAIGYSINAIDGVTITDVFDEVLEFAVTHFQIRFFSGSRLASRPKRLGIVDYDTAFTIKMVLGDSLP
jgi:N-acetyl-anhydromuramyl-L-alanine amidase AmpD